MISKLLKLYEAKSLRAPSFPLPVIAVLIAGLLVFTQPANAQSNAGSCSNGIAVPNARINPALVADCEVLLAARDTLAGTATLNWTENIHLRMWDGVTLDGSPIRVTGLSIWSESLDGVIPAELSRLTGLQELSLVGNELTGEIPGELGGLAGLETLSLSNNQLTGEIPPELGDLRNLLILGLSGNKLAGEIPPELGDLRNLEEMFLSGNQLAGGVPPEFGGYASLRELHIDGNRLTGEMPQQFTRLTSLEAFYFQNNAGICAPVDDVFQSWLKSILTAIGSSCAPTDSVDDRNVLVALYNSLDGVNSSENKLFTQPQE